MQYHNISDAMYDPNYPSILLRIPFSGRFLGKDDAPHPTSNDDGTFIQLSASCYCLVWDHGKHEHHFMHNKRCLPILHLNTGLKYYQAFCSWVTKSYHNAIHFAFSLVHSIMTDEIHSPLRSREGAQQAVKPDTDFVLGQDVLYMDGEDNQKHMVYKGATPDGQWHTIRRSNYSNLVTTGSHLRFLEQPDFTNIPSTPLDYCRKVAIGLSKEDAQCLAYLKKNP
jgi:hypothetical protein